MFERVQTTYRRNHQFAKIRMEAKLEVDTLEQRAMPALTADGFAPPELVHVGQLAAHTHEAAVRTDLFGVGAASEVQDVTWEEWFGGDEGADLGAQAPIRNDDPVDLPATEPIESPDVGGEGALNEPGTK